MISLLLCTPAHCPGSRADEIYRFIPRVMCYTAVIMLKYKLFVRFVINAGSLLAGTSPRVG